MSQLTKVSTLICGGKTSASQCAKIIVTTAGKQELIPRAHAHCMSLSAEQCHCSSSVKDDCSAAQ